MKIVKSFGFDNTVPYLVAATAMGLCSKRWRPFDHYLTNYFATLDGRKFSTSGGHAIWANEARSLLGTCSDSLRAYLCVINPQHRKMDFSRTDFRNFRETWETRLRARFRGLVDVPMNREDYAEAISTLKTQAQLLQPENLDLRAAFDTLDQWLTYGERRQPQGGGTSWNLAFATLAYPFLPALSKSLIDETEADNDFASRLPVDLAGRETLLAAYNYILRTPAKALIRGEDGHGHRQHGI